MVNCEFMLSIDCGTQSVRALLFDRDGNLFAKEKVEFEPYYSDYPGWAEQDANLYWSGTCTACQELKTKYPCAWGSIIGVSVTTQRDTCVNVDKDGNPLRPAIVWLDQRMAKCEEPMPKKDVLMFTGVGMMQTVDLLRKASRSNWIRENQPEIWAKTAKFLLLSGYLIYKLTGNFMDSSGSQIGHVPYDAKLGDWARKEDFKWKLFGIRRDQLPDLVKPGAVIGGVTKQAAALTGIPDGTKVIASGSDKGCETLGMGCLDMDCVSLSFGTTATVQVTTDRYFEPTQFMPAYPAAMPGRYNPEIEIFRGYWMISWFKKEFAARELQEAAEQGVAPEDLLDNRLQEVPPGCKGLILTPYWGPGLKMPEAKGSIIGFGDIHTRAYVYRAIIEGINYALLEGMENMLRRAKSTRTVNCVMVSGGGSRSDAICQITADMFGKTVYKGLTCETSGLGAAINGFVGLGVYPTYHIAVEKMVHYSKLFEPDPGNTEIYRNLHSMVYKNIYPRLKGLYKEIQAITDYPKL